MRTDAALEAPVGFIGSGTMGAPMASNLVRGGFHVVVWNRTGHRVAPVVAAGASAATSVDALFGDLLGYPHRP